MCLRKICTESSPPQSTLRFGSAHRTNDTPTVPATIAGWVIAQPRLTPETSSSNPAGPCLLVLAGMSADFKPSAISSAVEGRALESEPQTLGSSAFRSYTSPAAQCYISSHASI